MNGQNSNLNNGTNNGLNSETLGSTTLGMAQNIPNMGQNNINPTPTPNVVGNSVPNPMQMPNNPQNMASSVESLDPVTPSEPVARPIPGTEGTLTGNTVGANNSFTPSGNINGFTNSNKMENIGIVPPQNNETKQKKPMSKFLFVILIIALIGAVAFGVYYFLSISNNMVKLTPKTVSIGVGESVPDDIKEYATINKGDASACSVNTRNVDTSTIGEYEATIVCGKESFTTKVIVSDKTAPEVTLNVVFKSLNSATVVEDFVKSCTDPSNCKTSFADETKLKEYLATAGGPYDIVIEAKDDAGNTANYTATLYVTPDPISLFANFTSVEENLTDYKAKKTISDIFPINQTLAFQGVARRDYKYVFESAAAYNEVVKDKESTITFDGITGTAKYNDNKYTLEISTDLSLDTLKTENGGEFPTAYQDIQTIYKDSKGYTPSFIRSYPQTENEE